MTTLIQVGRNKQALVDDCDAELVCKHRWWFVRGYAYTQVYRSGNGKPSTITMHRLILNPSPDNEVDHINGDGLDNRRCNLREVTHAQNMQNRKRAQRRSATQVRGVFWERKLQKYRARIWVNHKSISLGCYASIEDARRAAEDGRRKYMTHSPECD
jgi:hypothetical protein